MPEHRRQHGNHQRQISDTNAPADKLTLVYAAAPNFRCDFDAAVPYLDVEKGNIQIRP